jgi:DNA-binding CsgD family transcriptional regulator
VILERSDELRTLDDALARVRAGDGCLVVVEGDAGIGKTTILSAALERAAAAGVRALHTTASELEQNYAYGVTIALFEPLVRGASSPDGLFDGVAGAARWLFTPGAEPESAPVDAFTKVLGLYWLALNAAEDGPILLVVDDAQWADGSSLRYCDYLSRRLEGLPIGLVLAFRSDVAAADAEAAWALRTRRGALHLRPKPLSEAAVGSLLERLGEDGADPELRRACWSASGGNPFYVTELIGTLRDGSIDDAEATAADGAGSPVPDRIMRHIEGRISRLDRTTRRVAEAFAILDDEANVRRAATVAAVADEQALDIVGELARAAILAGRGSTAFTHPVVRQAVYRLIPEPIRAHLHRRVGLLLHREGAPLGVVAGQLLAAERSADSEVVAILGDAARQARGRGDATVALAYLRRAFLEPPAPGQRDSVLMDLARAEAALAVPSAVDHFREAIEHVEDPRIKAELLLEQGYAQVNAADWAGAVSSFERGSGLVDGEAPDLRSRLEVGALSAAWLGTDRRVEQLLKADAILASRRLGSADRELALWIAYQRAAAGLSTAADLDEQVQGVIESTPIEELVADARSIELAAGALHALDRLAEDRDFLTRAIATAETTFAFGKVGTYSYYRAWPNYYTGELAAAEADAQTAMTLAEHGYDTFHPSSCAVLMFAMIERGDLVAAAKISGLENASWSGRVDATTMIPIARGRLQLEHGHVDTALVEFATARATCAAMGRRLQIPMDWRTWTIEALVQAGRRDEARDVAAEHVTVAEAWGATWPLGVALRGAGLAEGGSEGIEMMQRAVAILGPTPARLELARALVSLGAALRRHGSVIDARRTLTQAMDLAHRCGATGLAERARDELRLSGSRPRRYVLRGVGSLTPAERRVAELAADGRTNREVAQALFVTPKAVEYHLANAYRKLEIASRRELSTALRSTV